MTICIDCKRAYDDCAPWQIRLGCTEERCCMCQEDWCNEQDELERREREEKEKK